MLKPQQKPYLQELHDPALRLNEIRVRMLRLDVIHKRISGNKWYKLKYNLKEAISRRIDTVLTFGGAYSNHIHATAIAGSSIGLKSIGIIRGERVEPLNSTLKDAETNGMFLQFISRAEYQNHREKTYIKTLEDQFGEFYLIPEGGTNTLAIEGAMEIHDEISHECNYIITAVGTGGTMAGLVCGSDENEKVVGISILKGDFLNETVKGLINGFSDKRYSNWEILTGYHFGGYAKFNKELISFINRFKQNTGIPLDPVYTGKMMFAIFDLIRKGYFPKGTELIVIHTGGLQGIRGFNSRFGDQILI